MAASEIALLLLAYKLCTSVHVCIHIMCTSVHTCYAYLHMYACTLCICVLACVHVMCIYNACRSCTPAHTDLTTCIILAYLHEVNLVYSSPVVCICVYNDLYSTFAEALHKEYNWIAFCCVVSGIDEGHARFWEEMGGRLVPWLAGRMRLNTRITDLTRVFNASLMMGQLQHFSASGRPWSVEEAMPRNAFAKLDLNVAFLAYIQSY